MTEWPTHYYGWCCLLFTSLNLDFTRFTFCFPLCPPYVPYVTLTAVIHPSSPHPYLSIAFPLLCVPFLFLSLILPWWVSAHGDAELSEVTVLWSKWEVLQLNIVHTPLSHRYHTHSHLTMMTTLLGYINEGLYFSVSELVLVHWFSTNFVSLICQ